MKKIVLISLTCLFSTQVAAQVPLTLDECETLFLKNNLQLSSGSSTERKTKKSIKDPIVSIKKPLQ
jgi:hypothetical protein